MSVFITGDCHGNFRRFTKRFRIVDIKDNDYVIQLGDFGLLWDHDEEFNYNLKFFSGMPFTILWIGGNHENYNMIEEYPLEEWHGGLVRHIIRDKVIYLERGQIFDIDGNTYFTMGGAQSHDISDGILDRNDIDFKKKKESLRRSKKYQYRILNESWWKQELPTEEEIQAALNKLESVNNEVDYILTHCCSSETEELLGFKEHDRLTDFFNYIERFVKFKHWYFGHYHQDTMMYDGKHTVVYSKFIKI